MAKKNTAHFAYSGGGLRGDMQGDRLALNHPGLLDRNSVYSKLQPPAMPFESGGRAACRGAGERATADEKKFERRRAW